MANRLRMKTVLTTRFLLTFVMYLVLFVLDIFESNFLHPKSQFLKHLLVYLSSISVDSFLCLLLVGVGTMQYTPGDVTNFFSLSNILHDVESPPQVSTTQNGFHRNGNATMVRTSLL